VLNISYFSLAALRVQMEEKVPEGLLKSGRHRSFSGHIVGNHPWNA